MVLILLFLISSTSAASLRSLSITATNNKVGEEGNLIINITYTFVLFTHANIHLSHPDMSSFFPKGVSSPNSHIMTNGNTIIIRNVLLSGTDPIYEAYVILEGFVNPPTVRTLVFSCFDEGTNETITGVYNVNRGDIKDFIVTPDRHSIVAGYYPLKLSFRPGVGFPRGSRIIIRELILSNTDADCSSSITTNYVLSSISCLYISNRINITANTLTGGSEMLIPSELIEINIDRVKYSESMTARAIDMSLAYSNGEEFVGGTDTTSWKPAFYAPFTRIEGEFLLGNSRNVSTITILRIGLTPTWDIITSQLIKVEIIGIDHSSGHILGLLDFDITSQTSKTVVGNYKLNMTGGTNRFLHINFFLPSTEEPFRIQITTYLNNIESEEHIVHQSSSNNLNASKIISSDIGTIVVIGSKTVSELSIHSVTFQISINLSQNTDFKFTLPDVYDITEACKKDCEIENRHTFILKRVLSSDWDSDKDNHDMILNFETANPPTTKPVDNEFIIEGVVNGYARFLTRAKLSNSNEVYEEGSFSEFSIASSTYITYNQATYTISFETKHKILKDSIITIDFPERVRINSIELESVRVNNDFKSAYSESSNEYDMIVQGAFSEDYKNGAKVEIKIRNARNPFLLGEYTGFNVNLMNDGYGIASARGGSIVISEIGILPLYHHLSNEINSASSTYSFIFKSDTALPYMENIEKSLTMKIPSTVTCTPSTLKAVHATISHSGEPGYNIEISIDYPEDTKHIELTIECINPPTIKLTDPFIFELYFLIDNTKILSVRSQIQVSTSIASELIIVKAADNIPKYPGYISKSDITISRDNTIDIHKIEVEVPYAINSLEDCGVSTGSASCTLENGKVIIYLDSEWSTSDIIIHNLPALNPRNAGESSTSFVIKTFNKDGDYYLAHQSNSAGKIVVECNFPCKICDYNSVDKCIDCVDNVPGESYYLVKATKECKLYVAGNCDPGYFDKPTERKCEPCSEKCKECIHEPTYCTECPSSESFIEEGNCKTECSERYYSIGDVKICHQCKDICYTCKDRGDNCLTCNNTYFLHESTCIKECPNTTYVEGKKCESCSLNCKTCVDSANKCTSCNEAKLLEEDTYRCTDSCRHQYYLSDGMCRVCNASCDGCINTANNCIGCKNDLYFYNHACYRNCPASTYLSGTKCMDCDTVCVECRSPGNICISCEEGKVLDETTCASNCREGRYESSGVCEKCAEKCKACIGQSTFCTSCLNEDNYIYNGTCYLDCPEGTIRGVRGDRNVNVCLPCQTGCDVCSFNDDVERCIKCTPPFKLYDDGCVYVCPSDYVPNSDETACVPPSDLPPDLESESKSNYVPFPSLITAIIFLTIPIAGWARNPKSLLIENIIIGWAIILFITLIVQTAYAGSNKENTILAVSLAAVITSVILNILFIFSHFRHIITDKGFEKWDKANPCISKTIMILAYVISFQIRRFYYSRFAGFDFLFVQFSNITKLLNDLNNFSMAFILFTLLPICIIDIYGYLALDWGSQLYITIIESFILSVLMIAMILYQAKYGSIVPDNFFEHTEGYDTTHQGINDHAKIAEAARQNMLKELFKELPNEEPLVDKKRERINNGSDICLEEDAKEKDPREAKSFPCTPKTQQKMHGLFDEEKDEQGELIDNVIGVPVDVDPNVEKVEKEVVDSLTQTIPMAKLQEVKKVLQVIPKEEPQKKLFDLDSNEDNQANPFEEDEKTPKATPNKDSQENKDSQNTLTKIEDNIIQEYKEKPIALDFRQTSPKDLKITGNKTFFDMKKVPETFDSSEGYKFLMVKLDNQSTDIEVLKDISKEGISTLNTHKEQVSSIEKQSFVQEENKQANTIFMNDIKVAVDDDKVFEKTHNRSLDIDNIFGVFDTDETNAIIISETSDGQLLDKNKRRVNRFGYLIDKHGNIIDVNGEIVFTKEEFEVEMAKIDDKSEKCLDTKIENSPVKENNDNKLLMENIQYNDMKKFNKTMYKDPKKSLRNLELECIYSPEHVREDMKRYKNTLKKNRHISRKRPKQIHKESQANEVLFVTNYKKMRMPGKGRATALNKLDSEKSSMWPESNYEAIKKIVNDTKFPKVNVTALFDSP